MVAIFWWAIPKFADYRDVWAAIKTLTPIETWSLVAATAFNLLTYWWANQAALPGLGIGKAAVLTQTTTSVANTLPAGGAIAIGLTYSILDSWGFTGTSVALYVGVTGIWNIFTKLALPMLALVFLALSGHLTTTYILAAIFGVVVLGVAVGLFALVFRSEAFAIRIGNRMGRVVSWVRRLLHKPPVTTWGDGAARFRRDTIVLVGHRWLRLSLMTVLSQVALFFVLLLSLRSLGVSEQEVSTAEAFAVYAFSRLLSAVPITPGGVGLIDLGYIGGLTAFDSAEKAADRGRRAAVPRAHLRDPDPDRRVHLHHLARQVGLASSRRRGRPARASHVLHVRERLRAGQGMSGAHHSVESLPRGDDHREHELHPGEDHLGPRHRSLVPIDADERIVRIEHRVRTVDPRGTERATVRRRSRLLRIQTDARQVLDGALDGLERALAGWAASSTRNDPIAVRRRRTRCAPQPSARPTSATSTRTYVPPEQVIRTSRSRPSNAVTSNASTRIGRAGASSTSPLRAAS